MRRFFYFWSAVGVLLTGLYWLMYRRGFTLLAFFHYSAYAGILYLVLRVVGLLGGNGAFWQQAYTLYAKAAFVAVMAILVYGAWNALHPVVRTMEHDTGKHLSQPVKIVLVTDIHLGSLFGRQYAAELTALINRQNADVVLFGGDQVDNDLGYLLREKSYEPLRNIKSKHGVYAILGNHDHFSGRVQEELELFRSVGFHMLVDEAVDLPCGVHLAGLEDFRSEPRNPYLEKLAGTDPGKVNILLEHQPRRSCGYGLWGSPVRIGSTPEIVVITIK